MKREIIFILLFILALEVNASENIENYNDYTSLTIHYSSEGNLELQGSSGFDYFTATLHLFPLNSPRQEVQSLSTNPIATINSDSIVYRWDDFNNNLYYSLDSQIKTTNQIYPVTHARFPIQDLAPEYDQYLEAEEIIDITPEIVNKASEIIDGETDLYTAVYKIAKWVNEGVTYDLNTLTADAALKSSWVLQNGEGVCDEITSLFISLLRSVGIPAKFVSGVAYSNINYGFENHGWAEVYFPGQGWVPYDVTFTQFGWIDPGHLAMSKSLDAGQTTVKYSWKATNTELIDSSFSNEVDIVSNGGIIEPPFNVGLKTLANNVGPGSYVPIQVSVDNPYDKYLSDTLTITKAPSQISDNQKPILLKPSQKSSEFWIVQVPGDLNPGYIYTSEIEVKDLFGEKSNAELNFASNYDVMTKDEATDMINELQEKESKTYSEEVSLTCNPEKKYYYDFENPKIICEVKNIGNKLLNGVSICLNDNCQTKDLLIGNKVEVIFEEVPKESKLDIELTKDNISLISEVNLVLLSEPDLIITGLQSPNTIEYGKDFNLSFVLSSEATVKDIKIQISGLQPIDLEKEEKATTVLIQTNSKNFLSGKIDIKISFKDEFDRDFKIEKVGEITVTNMPWYAKIVAFFSQLFS